MGCGCSSIACKQRDSLRHKPRPCRPVFGAQPCAVGNAICGTLRRLAEKEAERREQGKPAHKAILRSLEENKERLEAVRRKRILLAQMPKGVNG